MSIYPQPAGTLSRIDWFLAFLRCTLGAWFIVGGVMKAVEPVAFLKALHEYQLAVSFFWLNGIAGVLPWLEVFCGLLLFSGRAMDASALVWLVLLVPFTLLVLRRALILQSLADIPLCAVRFDCGCGMGEIGICAKLAENLALILGTGTLLLCGRICEKSGCGESEPRDLE